MRLEAQPSGHTISIYGTSVPSDKALLAQARIYLQKQYTREQELEGKLEEIVSRFGSADFEAQRIRRELASIDNEAYFFDAHGQKVYRFECDGSGKVYRIGGGKQ